MNDPIRHRFSDKNWASCARLERPPEELPGDAAAAWLADVLAPLRLPPGFSSKVIDCVHNAIDRIPAAVRKVRLLVFTSVDDAGDRQTWGFFHMVRLKAEGEDPAARTCEIAIYLYGEGEPGPGRVMPG